MFLSMLFVEVKEKGLLRLSYAVGKFIKSQNIPPFMEISISFKNRDVARVAQVAFSPGGSVGKNTGGGKTILTPAYLWFSSERVPAHACTTYATQSDAFILLGKDIVIPTSVHYPLSVPSEFHALANRQNLASYDGGGVFVLDANSKNAPDAQIPDDASVIALANSRKAFSNPRDFVELATKVRERIGYGRLLYAPGLGEPSSLALLTYSGIDLFDSIPLIEAARDGLVLDTDGRIRLSGMAEKPCGDDFDSILEYNYKAAADEAVRVRNAIAAGTLRELVERRVVADTELVATLRRLDRGSYAHFEARCPVMRQRLLVAACPDSLNRPEIERFRRLVRERYRKPQCARVLLLLPCSARKPYSKSKSHQAFADVLFARRDMDAIHEVIVTSPLGIVPRELELAYPAAHYDVPVTGLWSEDEKHMIRSCVAAFLEKNSYGAIVSHLPGETMEFLRDLVPGAIETCGDSPTSAESLSRLGEGLDNALEAAKNAHTAVPGAADGAGTDSDAGHIAGVDTGGGAGHNNGVGTGGDVGCDAGIGIGTGAARSTRAAFECKNREYMLSRAVHQFGVKAGSAFMEGACVKGRYPFQKIFAKSGKQLGMLTDRGMISLTIEGGERVAAAGAYTVEIDDFKPRGSIFAVGVRGASSEIRQGDDVVVCHAGEVRAVGVACMNGAEMTELKGGEAVKTRHKTEG